MRIRTLERLGVFALVAGLVCVATIAILISVPDVFSTASDVSEVRTTLSKAQALRGQTQAADDRFDTVIAVLIAGVGTNTPEEIAADLDHVRTARLLEHALGRRTAESERSIDAALRRANETVAGLADTHSLVDLSPRVGKVPYLLVVLLAGLMFLSSGTILSVRALAVRRADLVNIAERLRIPVSHALDGSLGEEVMVYTITRSRISLHATAASAAPVSRSPSSAPETSASVVAPNSVNAKHDVSNVNHDIVRSPADAEHAQSVPSSSTRYLIDVEPLSGGRDR